MHGPPEVSVTIGYRVDRARAQIDESSFAALLQHALTGEKQHGDWVFAIELVDDADMSRMHEEFLGDPSPTDIMTFPYELDDGERGGDIVISIDTAESNAEHNSWTLTDELEFLVLHGLLHILGWDDDTPARREAMLARQLDLLQSTRRAVPSDDASDTAAP